VVHESDLRALEEKCRELKRNAVRSAYRFLRSGVVHNDFCVATPDQSHR